MFRRSQRTAIWIIVALLSFWTMFQLWDVWKDEQPPADARLLLYEVSVFQVELLSGFIAEASTSGSVSELNGLKQAAYSLEYTHGKLVEAWGGELPELASVSVLMEWIIRLQIGGDRTLKAEESELFGELNMMFQEIYNTYAGLMTPEGALIDSQLETVRTIDEQMASLLRKHVH